MESFDLIVIGAGPGGYVAAIRAAQLGLHCAVVEKDQVGGTCLNRGCIPTKTLLHSASLYNEIKHGKEMGIAAKELSYDIGKMVARKNDVTLRLRTGIEALLKGNGVTLIRGTAHVVSATEVAVGDEHYETKKILVAAGTIPSVPPIPGIKLPGVVTSDDLLGENPPFFNKLVIIGGGVIGVEFATLYNALGCEVTIIEAMDRLLPGMDREIAQNLSMILKKRGVKIHTAARVEEITRPSDSLNCRFTLKGKDQEIEADGILVSVGRRTNLAGLFEESVQPEAERGRLVINENYETTVPGIYAIGDAAGKAMQLAHVASAQGINAVCAIAGVAPQVDFAGIPSCVYTNPEISCVGISADEAKEAGIPVRTGKCIMSSNGKTLIENGDRGFIKTVFHAETGKLLGVQMMCGRATDMISEAATAIRCGLTEEQLSSVIRPHPTFCEAVTEAVEDASGHAIHIMPRKR